MRLASSTLQSLVLAALAAGVCGCADPAPPAGLWQGSYEDDGVMIAARLQIEPDGEIRVSAPNALMNVAAMSEGERYAMRERLNGALDAAWLSVQPIALEFDGETFRKPGGVAPQLEWDDGRMTLYFYQGGRASVRVPLVPVDSFGGS